MLVKNYLLKKRMKCQLVWEILFPILIVAYMKVVLNNPCNSEPNDCTPEEVNTRNMIAAFVNPIIMALLIPSIFSIGQRFILQTMVEDKMNKMRESLRLKSLTRVSYAMSFIFIQGIFALVAGLILMFGFLGDKTLFPADPHGNAIQFGIAVTLFACT
jgi:ABC-type Na+ efflux pump permease subunit